MLIIKILSSNFVNEKDMPADIDIIAGIANTHAGGVISPQNMLNIRRGQRFFLYTFTLLFVKTSFIIELYIALLILYGVFKKQIGFHFT